MAAKIQLPVLPTPRREKTDDLIRHFHRARLQWQRALAEEIACPAGTALADADYPAFNIILDAAVTGDGSTVHALGEVEATFGPYGGCRQWVLNPSADDEQNRSLAGALLAAGYQASAASIFHMAGLTTPAMLLESSRELELKILPARAALTHAGQLAAGISRDANNPSMLEASMRHLDDAHYDPLIAMRDSQAVARVGVLAVGQIGLIEELYVVSAHRGRGIGRLMLARALEIAVRSRFHHLFVAADPANSAAINLFMRTGFTEVGQFVSYHRYGMI